MTKLSTSMMRCIEGDLSVLGGLNDGDLVFISLLILPALHITWLDGELAEFDRFEALRCALRGELSKRNANLLRNAERG